jgi:hypothetical protein
MVQGCMVWAIAGIFTLVVVAWFDDAVVESSRFAANAIGPVKVKNFVNELEHIKLDILSGNVERRNGSRVLLPEQNGKWIRRLHKRKGIVSVIGMMSYQHGAGVG